jgi:two-component system, cell cycle sensor histidine kinase and response regulator CckA
MNAEAAFGLERAAWPALLVSEGGAVLRANAAAVGVFGVALEGGTPQLSAIWSPENSGTVEQFLARWEQSPAAVVDLKFRAPNGTTLNRKVAICAFSREGQKRFVVQFLPGVEPAPETSPAPGATKAEAADVSSQILKQKLDCALQLARTVSLDFNNALTSILGHTSFLLTKAEAGHPWRHSLMEVEKSAAYAAEIANDLAIFSRQEREAHRAPPGNLNVVVNRCVEIFRDKPGAAVVWKLQLEKGLLATRSDEAKVQQALTKILENAVEATNGGGQIAVQTRNVELTAPTQDCDVRLAAGAYICVEIADNGRGMEPEVLPRIFEPFFTTKSGGHRGLGMALVYGIVTNHGGGVAVSSQPGAGTSVRVYLPAEKQLVSETAAAGDDLNGTETILVVDDEGLLLTMTEMVLSGYGYKVLTANSGPKALDLLARDDLKVDLVITDLVMPGMSGRELVERIRQLAPATRILCMSGYTLPADKQTGMPYLKKPFTSVELLAKVRQTVTAIPVVDEQVNL